MFLKQYYLGCLAHASYMIADETTGVASIVDPQRDIDQYLKDANEQGWQIRNVFLTHFHADFLAGHIELRNRTGASIYLGAEAQADYAFAPLREGDVIEFGQVRLQILETPGHTPEGISILVYDLSRSDQSPHAVLTGDTLFIGDVGRPDLLASIGVTADELANMLYHSIHKLATLPDATLVYPAHGAGSMCGKNLSKETVSTIGEQKKYNYAMQPMSREDFVRHVTADQPQAPEYFVYDAIKNRQERQSLEDAMRQSLNSLSLDEVLRLQNRGAQLVDVRETIDFEGAHLADTIHVPLQGKYATWAGTVLSHKEPIVVVAEEGSESEAIMRLGRIGFDNVAGYLGGGMLATEMRPDLVRSTQRTTALALRARLADSDSPLVLDVRSERDWQQAHIPASINVPLTHLEERIDSLPQGRTIVVHCQEVIDLPSRPAFSSDTDTNRFGILSAGSMPGRPHNSPRKPKASPRVDHWDSPLYGETTMSTSTDVHTITCAELKHRADSGTALELVDVRTPAEFREVHAEPARNVPLERLDPGALIRQRPGQLHEPLYVICHSGSRGKQACEKLSEAGFEQVINVEGGTQAWEQAGLPVVRGKKTLSLERQVRIAAGLLVLLGSVSGYFYPPMLGLAAFVGAGLTFSGITDTCGMAMLLARMPWNQVKSAKSLAADNSDETC